MMTAIAPFRHDLAEAPEGGRAFWLTPPGARIRASIWGGGARGTVFLFNGRTEYIEKYGRVIGALVARGFCVATLDWRGQGLSDRLLDEPMKGHIGQFADYQNDVEALLAAPEVAALPQPHVLICHSMGGCIGLRALVDGRLRPAATIMSGPMLGIEMSGMERTGAFFLTLFADALGLGRAFTPGPKPRTPYVEKADFADNLLTHDAEHYEWMRAHLRAAPDLALGPPTLNWLARALEETRALAAAPPPESPIRIILGAEEAIVSTAAIRAFVARAPAAELVDQPACKHEGFMETDKTRAAIWAGIDRFLADQGI